MKKFTDWLVTEKDWIQGAVNPKHKGYCTPMSKKTCTPARKALARRFKHGDIHDDNEKKDEAWQQPAQTPIADRLDKNHQGAIGSATQAVQQMSQIAKQVTADGMSGHAFQEWQNFMRALSRIESVMAAESGTRY